MTSPLAPDGKSWLEYSAKHHESSASGLRASVLRVDGVKGMEVWQGQIKIWIEQAEKHEAMATACREAAGINQTKT